MTKDSLRAEVECELVDYISGYELQKVTDQILSLLEGSLPKLKKELPITQTTAMHIATIKGYNQAIADMKEKLK